MSEIKTTRTETTRQIDMPPSRPSTLSSVVAIVGMVAVLIIIIWGLIHLATLIYPSIASLFKNTPAEPSSALILQAPATAISGDPITVSWTYAPAQSGSYAFFYPCTKDFQYGTSAASGSMNLIPCGAAFMTASSSLTVIPLLSGTSTITEPLTVMYLASSGASAAQASASITIAPGHAFAQTTAVSSPPKTAAVTGPSDLSVRIISASIDGFGHATLVFDIANIGNGASGPYYFDAYLPTASNSTYHSPLQSSLAPGSHIVNTLRFTEALHGTVNVIVDPSASVNDQDRTNNYATAPLTGGYGY